MINILIHNLPVIDYYKKMLNYIPEALDMSAVIINYIQCKYQISILCLLIR